MNSYTPIHGNTDLPTAGTRVRLAATANQKITSFLTVKAPLSNASTIYVGGDTVTASNTIPLEPGESVNLGIIDPYYVFAVGTTNGDDATFLGA